MSRRKKSHQSHGTANRPRFWGKHAVAAALDNPERKVLRAWATREAAALHAISEGRGGHARRRRRSRPAGPARRAAPGRGDRSRAARGCVARRCSSADAPERAVLLVLDQVTDPHNVGAILRSAAAFGAVGIVTQDRHSPPESGALAKAASGALERVPWVARRQSRPRARGDRRGRLLAHRPRRRCRDGAQGRARAAAGRAGARRRRRGPAARTRASIATRWPGCRSPTRSKASTSPTRRRSRFMRRASPDGPDARRASRATSTRWPSREPAFAGVLEKHGMPEPRNSEPGAQTLLRTIVGQQVSVAAARSMWAKLEAAFGSPPDLNRLLAASDEELRAAGMSRQKVGLHPKPRRAGHLGRARPRQPARGRRGSDRAADQDQGHRPLVGGNLSAVRGRAGRRLPGGRPRGA